MVLPCWNLILLTNHGHFDINMNDRTRIGSPLNIPSQLTANAKYDISQDGPFQKFLHRFGGKATTSRARKHKNLLFHLNNIIIKR